METLKKSLAALILALSGCSRDNEDSSVVTKVEWITHDGKNNFYFSKGVRNILGYDKSCRPIIDEYDIGMYRATYEDNNGNIKTLQRYGRIPKIGDKIQI